MHQKIPQNTAQQYTVPRYTARLNTIRQNTIQQRLTTIPLRSLPVNVTTLLAAPAHGEPSVVSLTEMPTTTPLHLVNGKLNLMYRLNGHAVSMPRGTVEMEHTARFYTKLILVKRKSSLNRPMTQQTEYGSPPVALFDKAGYKIANRYLFAFRVPVLTTMTCMSLAVLG